MKIGFAKREISPPVGAELGGYAGYRPNSSIRGFTVPVTAFRFAGLSFVTVPGEFDPTLLPPETLHCGSKCL